MSIFFRDDNLDASKQSIIKFVVEEKPYKLLEVPFDLIKYVENLPQEIKNSYNPSNSLIEYLVKNGYEGENYTCNFLKISEKSSDLLVSITRGDSQYFLIIKSDNTRFLSYKEVGSIGEETKYFKIDNNYDIK